MFRQLLGFTASIICAATTGAAETAYHPDFRPDLLKASPAVEQNQVLVLGSPHLEEMPDNFKPPMLEPLLQRLALWKPEAIAVETLSGLQCDAMRRYPFRYRSMIEDYCVDTREANNATGLDVPSANVEAERLLAILAASATPAQRRRLAAVLLAAGEPASAQVQWIRLPEAERIVADGLSPKMVERLNANLVRSNEITLVAATLAARLGMERVWAVDDHTADFPTPDNQQSERMQALMRAWDNPDTKARLQEAENHEAGSIKPGGVMAMYRAYNRRDYPDQAFRSDFGAALTEPSPQHFGRAYLGYWETRNLRMVANIRDVLAQRAGGTRLLAIVGASHKGYCEAYLNLMHDVRLVDAQVVLHADD